MSKNLPVPAFPSVMPGGEMLPFMSHRDREHFALSILEEAGGWQRMTDLLKRDPEKFYECYKEFFFKRLPKPTHQVQHGMTETTEQLLERLSKAEASEIIEGDAKDITPRDD